MRQLQKDMSASREGCAVFLHRNAKRQDTNSEHCSLFIPTLTENELITKYTT